MISIITPVYNVRPYLPRCIDSLLAQTYTDLEIILINDGSTDGSGAICDEYAKKDSRIRVIHQANAGVSSARNAGLAVAGGDWIGFVDSDDWAEREMYKRLLQAAEDNGKQIAVCGYFRHRMDRSKGKKVVHRDFPKVITRDEALEHAVRQRYLEGQLWNMLFSRHMLEKNIPVRFNPEVYSGEDRLFTIEAFSRSDGAAYLAEPLFHYCPREDSITSSFNTRRVSVLRAYDNILHLLTPVSEHLARRTRFNYMDASVYLINRAVRSGKRRHLPMLRKAGRRYALEYFMARDLSLAKKLRNAMVLFFPGLTNKVWSLLQRRYSMTGWIKALNKR